MYRKIWSLVNIICLTGLMGLGTGFSALSTSDGAEASARTVVVTEKKPGEKEPAEDKSGAEEELSPQEEAVEELVSSYVMNAEAPELRCPGFTIGEDTVIFANPRGGYTMQDTQGKPVFRASFESEDGELTVSCRSDRIVLSESPAVVDGHTIEYDGTTLYYDKSPVTYEDTAFSAYKLNDDYTVECTAEGKYTLRQKDGKTTGSCTIRDDSGVTQNIYADETGFAAINPDDLLEIAFRLNGDLIGISGTLRLYINGAELVPPGYNDMYSEGRSTQPKVSKTPLDAGRPPSELGAVRTDNAGVTQVSLEMLGLVNEFRRKYGLGELYGLAVLDGCAQRRAGELVTDFSHERPEGGSYESVLDEAGLLWWSCGEDIGFSGSEDPAEIFDAWIRSEEHRANILDPKAKYMAVGVKVIPRDSKMATRVYWDMLFLNDVYVSG